MARSMQDNLPKIERKVKAQMTLAVRHQKKKRIGVRTDIDFIKGIYSSSDQTDNNNKSIGSIFPNKKQIRLEPLSGDQLKKILEKYKKLPIFESQITTEELKPHSVLNEQAN